MSQTSSRIVKIVLSDHERSRCNVEEQMILVEIYHTTGSTNQEDLAVFFRFLTHSEMERAIISYIPEITEEVKSEIVDIIRQMLHRVLLSSVPNSFSFTPQVNAELREAVENLYTEEHGYGLLTDYFGIDLMQIVLQEFITATQNGMMTNIAITGIHDAQVETCCGAFRDLLVCIGFFDDGGDDSFNNIYHPIGNYVGSNHLRSVIDILLEEQSKLSEAQELLDLIFRNPRIRSEDLFQATVRTQTTIRSGRGGLYGAYRTTLGPNEFQVRARAMERSLGVRAIYISRDPTSMIDARNTWLTSITSTNVNTEQH